MKGARGLLSLSILMLWGCSASALADQVNVLATGKAQGTPILLGWILTEPSIRGTVVPTRESGDVTAPEIKRLMRIYFPRTFDELLRYDFLFLAQVDMSFISPKQALWMYDGIAEYGLGAVNTRSVMSMNNYLSEPWAQSVLSQAFPNDAMAVIKSPYYLKPSGPIKVNADTNLPPVISPFKADIERIFPGYAGLLTVPRPGSRIYSWLKTGLTQFAFPLPGYIPHIFEWNYQRGITFTFMDMVYDNFWRTNINPFALDIVVNVIWRGAHRELPTDALKVHLLRQRLLGFNQEKSAVLAVFDFAEKFGANTARVYAGMRDADGEKTEADSLYIGGDFDGAYAKMSDAFEKLNALTEQAIRLKDQALTWVYVVEWLSVSGTSLLCGLLVWFLMVRRRLYREAGVTRGSSEMSWRW